MLQYSSLVLCVIVIVAYYNNDTIIHHQWLAVLSTSLINHTSKGTIIPVKIFDRILCHINALYCVYRTYFMSYQIQCINGIIFLYLLYIFHIGGQCHKSDYWHMSVHFTSTIAVLNTMRLFN